MTRFDELTTKEAFDSGNSLFYGFTYPESKYELEESKVKSFIAKVEAEAYESGQEAERRITNLSMKRIVEEAEARCYNKGYEDGKLARGN